MKKVVTLLLLCIAAAVIGTVNSERFDGYSVVRVKVTTFQQRQVINKLVERGEASLWDPDYLPPVDDLEEPLEVVMADVMVSREARFVLEQTFVGLEEDFSVMIEDLQALIEQERLPSVNAKASWFDKYHTFDEIFQKTRELAGNNTNLVKYNPSIGRTIEGRDIISVSLYGGSKTADVPQIFVMGGQHAREWIGPATVMYVFEQLVNGYGTDPEVTALLNAANVTIVPLVNVDGYHYTWTTNRMWRKNRRANTGGYYGVDLNRNWDVKWGTEGISKNPSSDVYCGTAPFSEPETTAVSRLFNSLSNVKVGLDVHSYSQLILRPYGWTRTPCPDETVLSQVGSKMSSIIEGVHGLKYTSQPSISLYPTSGTASDWFYERKAVYSYTFELRDTGHYGFILPPEQIIPTGEEIWPTFKYLFQYAIDN